MSFRREFEHRERLRRSAIEEFVAHGYERASINRILAAAGMSKGQFYHHFGGKEGLYLALVEDAIDRKRAHFEAHPVPDEGDFFATLRAQVRAGLAFAKAHPDLDAFTRSFLRERGRPIFRRTLATFAFDEPSPVARLVERFHARGAFHRSLSLELVRALVSAVLQQSVELLELRSPEDFEARLDELLGFLERGLRRSPADD